MSGQGATEYVPSGGGGARGGGSVVSANVTFLSSHVLRCLMPRARLERMMPSRRGHVWCTHGRPSITLDDEKNVSCGIYEHMNYSER